MQYRLSVDLKDMELLASRLAPLLVVDDLIFLNGPPGAGKTTFISMLGNRLGVDEPMTSPTYAIINSYGSIMGPINHIDAYRLPESYDYSFIDDILKGSITFLEWPANIPPIKDCSINLDFNYEKAEDRRTVSLSFIDRERGEAFWNEYFNN